ncbi:YeeE/YedE family protein [Afifella pfennigii]|uniref:YeeE/YedE family protein n=1 Tax=Afifella pfennigii TaxID=209897 RepID=UPI000552A28D|nr:YeeE/YedE family protein [Afifella pfennigii]
MSVSSEPLSGARLGATTGIAEAVDRTALFFSLAALTLLTLLIGYEVSPKMASLFLIGAGLGVALLHGAFGFTAGWRNVVTRRDGRGLRAQLWVIGATALLFVPLINGLVPGLAVQGAIAPVGTSLIVGAFLFGLGMQLGNGCGSGTLFTLGGGSGRMLITLAAFIVGSVVGSVHLPWWLDRPGFDPVNLAEWLSVPGALALILAGLAAVGAWTLTAERKAGFAAPVSAAGRFWRGPWPLLWAGAALVVLNLLTLLIAGHPWTITYGFALWGAKAAQALGLDMSAYEFWQWPKGAEALSTSLLADVTSVMNIGLVLGAMAAAALAGSFAKAPFPGMRSALGAVIGGLLMGYGARLGFGCNIGAFLGGIASGSLHGWLWFASAFAGTLVGIRLRPLFGLGN